MIFLFCNINNKFLNNLLFIIYFNIYEFKMKEDDNLKENNIINSNNINNINNEQNQNLINSSNSITNNEQNLQSETIPKNSENIPNENIPLNLNSQNNNEINNYDNINEKIPLYICNPFLNKERTISFIQYTLKGNLINKPLIRRYSDFFALNKKFYQRWPGILLPNIPPKVYISNLKDNVINLRINLINKFLLNISNTDYLLNSDEMKCFLDDISNIPKSLDYLPKLSYEDILKKYSTIFINYDDNFDLQTYIENQDNFFKKLLIIFNKLKVFKNIIEDIKEKNKLVFDNSLLILSLLQNFEKEILIECLNKDESKLIFFNKSNQEINNNINDLEKYAINPFDKIFLNINEDYINTEALINAFQSLNNLKTTHAQLIKNLTSINQELSSLEAGKTTLKSLLRFKNKNEIINILNIEKEKTEKNINFIAQIIRICTFVMNETIKNFKVSNLKNYYQELNNLVSDSHKNIEIFDKLWNNALMDKNISNYH